MNLFIKIALTCTSIASAFGAMQIADHMDRAEAYQSLAINFWRDDYHPDAPDAKPPIDNRLIPAGGPIITKAALTVCQDSELEYLPYRVSGWDAIDVLCLDHGESTVFQESVGKLQTQGKLDPNDRRALAKAYYAKRAKEAAEWTKEEAATASDMLSQGVSAASSGISKGADVIKQVISEW